MLEARLQQQFFESADLLYQSAESLSKPLATAAQLMLNSVTAGSRLLVAGHGLAASEARQLGELLLGRLEHERPGLAALALSPQLGSLQGVEAFSRQVLGLGHPGDLLLWLDAEAQSPATELVAAAHEQDMAVLALAPAEHEALRRQLSDTDVFVPLPAPRLARRLTLMRVALLALCDALDAQLLGLET